MTTFRDLFEIHQAHSSDRGYASPEEIGFSRDDVDRDLARFARGKKKNVEWIVNLADYKAITQKQFENLSFMADLINANLDFRIGQK